MNPPSDKRNIAVRAALWGAGCAILAASSGPGPARIIAGGAAGAAVGAIEAALHNRKARQQRQD